MSPERQTPVPIEEEMRKSYLAYAMSVIVGRALYTGAVRLEDAPRLVATHPRTPEPANR